MRRLRARDAGLLATRRAGRAAILVPCLLWVGKELLDNPTLGTFAALGAIAMLVFVDFGGPMHERVLAQSMLVLAGAALVCLGTLASQVIWVATIGTFAVVFAVLFAGIFSSLLAGSTTVLLVSFVLPVTLPGSAGEIPDRLLGWLLAGAVSVLAIRVLWPAPTREPLRKLTAEACTRFALQMRAEVDCIYQRFAPATLQVMQGLRDDSASAARALRDTFFATPYRPAGLSTSSRAQVRITDQVIWLDRVFARAPLGEPAGPASDTVCALTIAAAELLEYGAALLVGAEEQPGRLDDGLRGLRIAREAMEDASTRTTTPSIDRSSSSGDSRAGATGLVSSLQPSFRAQEISFVVSSIATDVQLAVAARQRSWWQRLLGRGASEHGSAWSSIKQRASAHLEPHSGWLHNSLRGGVAFALAVLVAELSDVQHAFWVVFGALAVLRSNALSTGEDAVRALLGTVVGILIGGGLVALIGSDSTLSWLVLAPAVALVALGPITISFAVGQVGFTTTLLLLNNIIVPGGWSVGLVRIEDIALGCGVSVLVGALFWPRGAGRALGQALADGFSASAGYLHVAIEYGISRCDSQIPPSPRPREESRLATAAGRRLDDAFRGFIAERGTKQLSLADGATLVGGVSLLRLTADAVIDLWERDDKAIGGNRVAARRELSAASASLIGWYGQATRALAGLGPMPAALTSDQLADARLLDVVQHDLNEADGQATATAVKLIWTADHIDAARRLQAQIVESGISAVQGMSIAGTTPANESYAPDRPTDPRLPPQPEPG